MQSDWFLAEHAGQTTINPGTTMSATIMLFIVAGVLLLLFTRFDHSKSAIQYHSEKEDFSRILPPSLMQEVASASTSYASEPDYGQYLPKLYQLLITHPQSDSLHYYIGICYLQQEKSVNAIRSFRKVLRERDSKLYPKAEYHLGLAYWQVENMDEAQRIFAAISRKSNHPHREKAASILKEDDFS